MLFIRATVLANVFSVRMCLLVISEEILIKYHCTSETYEMNKDNTRGERPQEKEQRFPEKSTPVDFPIPNGHS